MHSGAPGTPRGPRPQFGDASQRGQEPAAAVCGTRDGRANPSRFCTGKYSLRPMLPMTGSSRLREASTEAASQMHTARVPSGVGNVW